MLNDKISNGLEQKYYQSAVIPFRKISNRVEILLITSLMKKRWIIPKGIIEDNMTPMDSAAKEAQEEAGVLGYVYTKCMGHYTYEKWGGVCYVEVYPLKVTKILDEWEEKDLRKRKWFSIKEAIKMLENSKFKLILKEFKNFAENLGDL